MSKIVNLVPEPVKDLVRGTRIESFFWSLQSVDDTVPVSVQTPIGPLSLEVHEMESWFVEKYGEGSGKMYEPSVISDLTDRLGDDTVFYDVGARWGIFSKVALELGVPSESIYLFEADEFNVKILEKNIEKEERINNKFVSHRTTDGRMALDDYISNHTPPDVMKIDIEGAEGDAITGAEELLQAHRPTLYIEMHPEYIDDYGGSQKDIIEKLEELDYSIEISIDHRQPDAGWEPITKSSLPTTGDYLIRCIYR